MTGRNIPGDEHAMRHAFYREMDEVIAGRQELTWPLWAMPVRWSSCLTEAGRGAAGWAVDVLRRALDDDFLARLRASGQEHPILTPAILVTLWPMAGESRRLYEDLLRLAAQFEFARRHGRQWYDLRTILSKNCEFISWTHSLLQLQWFGLAHRASWRGTFEPALPAGRPGDLLLEHTDGTRLLVEFTSMGMSASERAAEDYYRRAFDFIRAVEFQHNVSVRGSLGVVAAEDVAVDWLRRIEAAAIVTAGDGQERHVPGPPPRTISEVAAGAAESEDLEEPLPPAPMDAPAEVWVTHELAVEPGEPKLVGGVVTGFPWPRLEARIKKKAERTAVAGWPTWIHVEDESGFWFFTRLANMTLAERLADLMPWLRAAIEPYPHIVGIVLSPGVMWDTGIGSDEAINLPGVPGALAVRRLVAQGRARETIIVTRSGRMDTSTEALAEWCRSEDDWLAWALRELGQPPLEDLFR